MKRKIIGFHQDDYREWIADLECGHTQHVRHEPPFQDRAWVLTSEGRAKFIGAPVVCKLCSEKNTLAK